jgi:hypothetical protein
MSGVTAIRTGCQCGRSLCECGRETGKVHCPVHDAAKNGRPDLSVAGDDRQPLVYCHVCGKPGQAALIAELKARGLWSGRAREKKERRTETGRTSWHVRDVTGIVQAVHERIDYLDGSKSFVWRRPGGGTGLNGRKTASLPLYGSEQLDGLPSGTTVVLCEGEKAADAARRLGKVALGTVTGAGNPIHDDAVLRTLTPFDIVLWPDNDDTGRAHMVEIGRRLLALREVR